MRKYILITLFLIIGRNISAQDNIIGEIRIFAGNFAPKGWALCQGQTLPISNNEALYSILGTTYGGDGVNTFNLPDMRGRVVVHPNSSNHNLSSIGQRGGTQENYLLTNNLPAHNHSIIVEQPQASIQEATTVTPQNKYVAVSGTNAYSADHNATTATSTATTSDVGSYHPVNNIQPYTVINYIICIEGIYPSRN